MTISHQHETPALGVLDGDGLHLPDGSRAPITGTIRHVGDLYKGARRYGLLQLWLTDAWVRAADLPATLEAGGRFREMRHPFGYCWRIVEGGLTGDGGRQDGGNRAY